MPGDVLRWKLAYDDGSSVERDGESVGEAHRAYLAEKGWQEMEPPDRPKLLSGTVVRVVKRA